MSSSPIDVSSTALSSLELAIGRRIAQVRATRGLTLDRLAQMTGFTKGYLSKIENSKVIPPIGTLIKIARQLEAEVADLLQNDKSMPQDPVSILRSWRSERVIKGGGTLVHGPSQVPGGGWIAQCLDPQGALFGMASMQG